MQNLTISMLAVLGKIEFLFLGEGQLKNLPILLWDVGAINNEDELQSESKRAASSVATEKTFKSAKTT